MSTSHISLLPSDPDSKSQTSFRNSLKDNRYREINHGRNSEAAGSPNHKTHEEVTKIELFYDLFFVANLTVFTYIHSVSDGKSLLQYIWFFCILWFSWYQVALFDVRYSKYDCLIHRLAKVVQFGVMIMYAAVGPMFKLGESQYTKQSEYDRNLDSANSYYGVFTLSLMTSRLVLALQYYVIRRESKHSNPSARKPLSVLITVYGMAATIYFVAYFFFTKSGNSLAWISWFVIAPLESIVATSVACTSHEISPKILRHLPWLKKLINAFILGESDKFSFSNKLLVERLSLLTLIILGEGAISIAKQCQIIADLWTFPWSATNVTNIFCSVVIVYCLYLLYFDWMEAPSVREMGHLRQRIWASLHFPFHLFLVLAIQGIKLSILWSAATENIKKIDRMDESWTWQADMTPDVLNQTQFKEVWHNWNSTLRTIVEGQSYAVKTFPDALDAMNDDGRVTGALNYLQGKNRSGAPIETTIEDAICAYRLLNYTAKTSIYTLAGFSSPGLQNEETESLFVANFTLTDKYWHDKVDAGGIGDTKFLKATQDHFKLTYRYMFISIGFVVLLSSALAYLGQKEERHEFSTRRRWQSALIRGRWYHRLRLSWSALVGTVLCLLTLKNIWDKSAFLRSVSNPWMLPTMMALLLSCVLLNSINIDCRPLRPLARLFGETSDTISPETSNESDVTLQRINYDSSPEVESQQIDVSDRSQETLPRERSEGSASRNISIGPYSGV